MDFCLFVIGWIGEVHQVLVGVEDLLRNQLGNGRLGIDWPSKVRVLFPFGRSAVVRRRGRERNYRDVIAQLIQQRRNGSMPFRAKVVRLVQANR